MTAKGKYYWDITAYGNLVEQVPKLKEIDRYLKEEFPDNVTVVLEEEQ